MLELLRMNLLSPLALAFALGLLARVIRSDLSLPKDVYTALSIYLLFALGRADVFPADDLAVQVAYQRLRGLDARPKPLALRRMVEHWAPWRGVGAMFLWHCYGSATLDREA